MEGIMNSKVMIGLQTFGQKLGANKFVSSLSGSMMGSMSLIMTGSVFQIICALLAMFGVSTDSTLYVVLYMPYNFTMGLIALWITGMIGYNYARARGCKSPLATCIETLAAFTLVACWNTSSGSTLAALDTTYLGSQGLFIGFLVAFVVVEVDHFCQVKNIQIRMPEVCPPSLVNSMAAIIPCFFNMAIWLIVSTIISMATGGVYTLASGFMAVLSYPLSGLVSVPGLFILCLFATLMWFFGIHGTMLIVTVLMAPMMQVAAENAAIWEECQAAGMSFYECQRALTFSPVALFGAMACAGGTGNTLSLCIMGLRAKSEQIKAVAKVGLVPGWFGINEPVTFGMPIMYNPILGIPYILNCLVCMLIWLIAFKIHIIYPAHVYIGALMPMGIAQFLSTFNWVNALMDYICIIPSFIIFYPFFKLYDKQLYTQEQAAKIEEN